MKGFRFYADLTTEKDEPHDVRHGKAKRVLPLRTTVKQLRDHASTGKLNCLALLLDDTRGSHLRGSPIWNGDCMECVASVYSWPDSPCTLTSIHWELLHKMRRIPEELARKLHPQLFVYLDSD